MMNYMNELFEQQKKSLEDQINWYKKTVILLATKESDRHQEIVALSNKLSQICIEYQQLTTVNKKLNL